MPNSRFRVRPNWLPSAVRSLTLLSMTAALALAPAPAAAKSVLLPWIAQTRGVLAQSSDLYVHNPGRAPLAVALAVVPPDGHPIPCAGATVEPGATWSTVDARRRLCGNAGVAGLLVATVDEGAVEPVLASFDTFVVRGGGRFARTSPAMHDADAAQAGQAQHLAGLRQGDASRTALWLYNPATAAGEYDLVYRALDGSELATATRVSLGAGKLRQISPSQHPIPAVGPGGFTVEIVVRSGALLSLGIVDDGGATPTIVESETR